MPKQYPQETSWLRLWEKGGRHNGEVKKRARRIRRARRERELQEELSSITSEDITMSASSVGVSEVRVLAPILTYSTNFPQKEVPSRRKARRDHENGRHRKSHKTSLSREMSTVSFAHSDPIV